MGKRYHPSSLSFAPLKGSIITPQGCFSITHRHRTLPHSAILRQCRTPAPNNKNARSIPFLTPQHHSLSQSITTIMETASATAFASFCLYRSLSMNGVFSPKIDHHRYTVSTRPFYHTRPHLGSNQIRSCDFPMN